LAGGPEAGWDLVWRGPGFCLGVSLAGGRVRASGYLPAARAVCGGPGSGPGAEVIRQLDAWAEDPRHVFDLPLAPAGTPFRLRVWQALRTIPAGETRTYGELARRLGTSPRAIGGACAANPLPLFVPCHRVVAAVGSGGFAGQRAGPMPALKRRLLAMEAAGADAVRAAAGTSRRHACGRA